MAKAKFDLLESARAEMVREGFSPDFPSDVLDQAANVSSEAKVLPSLGFQDLRHLLWSSIDNSSSKDLDQIEFAERLGTGIRILVAIADVDEHVPVGSPVDRYARFEGTSVYAPGHVFPMLPPELSTNASSLLQDQDRLAIVVEMVVMPDGTVAEPHIYRALVRNRCQLSYGWVGPWLEGQGRVPDAIATLPEMQAQLRLQDEAAVCLRAQRHRLGALQFDRPEAVTIMSEGKVQRIEARQKNRAADLIEDFMIATNEAMANTLSRSGVSGIRRVVKSPERWPRIVAVAATYGFSLPSEPDGGALSTFLADQKQKDPDRFPDLSLSVMKLMGPGEYVLVQPGAGNAGHFGLASHDYTHSTAPNRRFADLVTQRLLKAMLEEKRSPYADDELEDIARSCTTREDAGRKVERAMNKRAAAFAIRSRVGQIFRAVITGANDRGVFARVADPPIEGRVIRGEKGLDVGDRVKLTLLSTDPERGFIDFGK